MCNNHFVIINITKVLWWTSIDLHCIDHNWALVHGAGFLHVLIIMHKCEGTAGVSTADSQN